MSKFHSRTLTKKDLQKESKFDEPEIDRDQPNRAIEIARRRNEFSGVAERIAEHKLCELNWYFPLCDELFPFRPKMRYVRKYFPLAAGGPLLVDEPQDEAEIEECKTKAAVLKAQGHRYVWVTQLMSIEEAMIQLEAKPNDMVNGSK
jgi:hypothetical protein